MFFLVHTDSEFPEESRPNSPSGVWTHTHFCSNPLPPPSLSFSLLLPLAPSLPPPFLSLSGAGGVHAFPSSPPQAKALMLFNLAIVISINKDYDKARRALQTGIIAQLN